MKLLTDRDIEILGIINGMTQPLKTVLDAILRGDDTAQLSTVFPSIFEKELPFFKGLFKVDSLIQICLLVAPVMARAECEAMLREQKQIPTLPEPVLLENKRITTVRIAMTGADFQLMADWLLHCEKSIAKSEWPANGGIRHPGPLQPLFYSSFCRDAKGD